MLDSTTLGLFALAVFTLSLIPGPDMIYIATRSLAQGRSAGLASLLGIYTGILVHTLIAAMGLSALFAASATALNVVKYAGAAYLIYLGVQAFMSKAEVLSVQGGRPADLRSVYFQGLFVNVLNPKMIVFFLAFLPQFLEPAQGHVPLQIVVLSLLLFVVSLPSNFLVALSGGWLGAWLRARQGVKQASKWVAGSVYIALGLATALTSARKH